MSILTRNDILKARESKNALYNSNSKIELDENDAANLTVAQKKDLFKSKMKVDESLANETRVKEEAAIRSAKKKSFGEQNNAIQHHCETPTSSSHVIEVLAPGLTPYPVHISVSDVMTDEESAALPGHANEEWSVAKKAAFFKQKMVDENAIIAAKIKKEASLRSDAKKAKQEEDELAIKPVVFNLPEASIEHDSPSTNMLRDEVSIELQLDEIALTPTKRKIVEESNNYTPMNVKSCKLTTEKVQFRRFICL